VVNDVIMCFYISVLGMYFGIFALVCVCISIIVVVVVLVLSFYIFAALCAK